MRQWPRLRFWVEAGLGALSTSLFGLTLFVPDWIEAVFRVDPDQHSGSLEWLIIVALFLVTLGSAVLTRFEWKRPLEAAERPLAERLRRAAAAKME